nr:succinylglutamate desuccinylase [Burkholderiaceae bacterium]
RDVARDMCLRFLVAAGTLGVTCADQSLAGWRLSDAPRQWALEVTGGVVARSAQFRFTEAFQGLEVIAKAGTVIGDNDGQPVLTPYDDCVLVMPSVRQANPGVTVVRFARQRPLI